MRHSNAEDGMKIGSLLVLFVCPIVAEAASPEAVYAKHGMVTSRSALASNVGIEIIRDGGNAVDAAVATAFALAVTYPSAGNIGGGGFAVIRLEDGTVKTLDHRETAPATAERDMYLDDEGDVISGLSTRSHLAAGVPGSVDGLLTLLATHGTMRRQKVLRPAIQLARRGFPLTYDLARQFAGVLKSMSDYPASMAKFSQQGEPFQFGDLWRQPDLAKTLQRISNRGRAGFYEGRVADLIVAEMDRGHGQISHADLKRYRSIWRDPVKGSYRGYEVWSMGPPSSGGTLLIQMLNMLEPLNLAAMGWGSAATIHHMVEAQRRAYADRAEHLADPDYYDVPLNMLLDKDYAKQRYADVDPDRATGSEQVAAGHWPEESPETTHFSVMDAGGMMVALTTTLNSGYGNKIVVPGTGVLLNNEMNDFSVKADTPNQFQLIGREANAIAPGKRMLSSMSPTLVTKDGAPFMATGSPGGSTIITTTLQVIINVIDHGMAVDDAVSLPRFHHQWQPDVIRFDKFALNPDTRKKLRHMGHQELVESNYVRGIGDANSILYRDGLMHGIKDPRNDGLAVGF